MKNLLLLSLILVLIITFTACDKKVVEEKSFAGTYIGYSWKAESKGTTLEDASQKIQTILTLDDSGVITDASILFWKLSGGSWYSRQDSTARVSVNLDINPVAATPGKDYKKGTSMFKIDTHDLMSLYSVSVGADGTTALLIVEPVTRYQFEIKLLPGYNYATAISEVPIDGTSGGFIPTVRASSSGLMKPASWSELSGMNIFSVSFFDHVMMDDGPFKGLNESSTIQELLEAAGVTFKSGKPEELGLVYGRHSAGGWQGNYENIEEFLIGKNAADLTSLVDWSKEKWAKAINDENFFGV
ncbi:MAG: hypothetical protein KAR21_01910, partial [Spirochaetales bacterium]|nr:hypothetical protein [Spirochaetales bacterium]